MPNIDHIEAAAYKIPTDSPESDGTLQWDSTTLVVVHVTGGGMTGVGYTYTHAAAALLVREKLAEKIAGVDAMDIPTAWQAMNHAVRNLGRPGLGMMAISAVDCALWDLKAKLLDLPLARLLGQRRPAAPVYGSGGFTSYSEGQLTEQLAGWVAAGIPRVKMKVGRDPAADPQRVGWARDAIGDAPELFVDGNGAYGRKQALRLAQVFAGKYGVGWFEEPRSSEDLEGLRLLRDRGPGGMDIAAGEYGWDLHYFKRMLDAGAVDCLQADITRCGGVSGFLGVAALCEAYQIPLSAHCAPAQHLHPCCAIGPLRHIEYFHDHVRIESMLFDGFVGQKDGEMRPDLSRPGMGMEFKGEDAEKYRVG